MLHGYAGRILWVDLTTGRIHREKSDPGDLKSAIGGRGLNSRRIAGHLDRGVDPQAPENMVLMAAGPLTGSLLSASAPMIISGKSPLTGLMGHSEAGGFLGPELKTAGYDQVIITGRSEQPCYLLITSDQVEIRDAGHLWGRDTWQTTKALRQELNDHAVQVAAIGPAGENLVRFAGVVGHNAPLRDRSGMGCLFGAKQLKAVAVRGAGLVTLAAPLTFLDLCRQLDERIMAHPQYEERRRLGSTRLMTLLNGLGMLPTNHFQKGVCGYVDRVNGERLVRDYQVKPKGCFNCNLHCSRYYVTDETEGEGPDFETLWNYTCGLGNDDLKFALRINTYLTRMGLDPVSSGETIGWAMECVQQGLLTKDDLDGLDFTWGRSETIEQVLDLIVHRRGVGDWLAEGAGRPAQQFGRGTERYVLQVKGQGPAGGDPRGLQALGPARAVVSGGTDLPVEPFIESPDQDPAALVEQIERQTLLADCLTVCREIGVSMDLVDLEFAAQLLTAGTGIRFTPDQVDRALRGIIDANRRLDLDFGLKPEDDALPPRFTDEPLQEGASRDRVVPLHDMVLAYYRLRGWDDQGRPPKS